MPKASQPASPPAFNLAAEARGVADLSERAWLSIRIARAPDHTSTAAGTHDICLGSCERLLAPADIRHPAVTSTFKQPSTSYPKAAFCM
ncbi:hypothetical protein KC333_g107 [Hortaea werneckii]|nr:hypothetical protein KC333_g107 [Hortaea werneckii]